MVMNRKLIIALLIFYSVGVINAYPQSVEYYLKKGRAYYKKGEYDKAIPEFQKAVFIDPGDADNYLVLGLAYHLSLKYDEAIIQYQTAIEIDPDHAHSYGNLGYVYGLKGDEEKEKEYLQKARELFVRQGDFIYVNEIDAYLSYLKQERKAFEELKLRKRFEK
jgi:tetratricopeptide (TPR) repeat protein